MTFRSIASSCLGDAAQARGLTYQLESPRALAQPANPHHFLPFPSIPPIFYPENCPITSEQIAQLFAYFSCGKCPSLNYDFQENPSYPAVPAWVYAQFCPTLCDPMDRSPQGSSVHRSFQARILE